MNNSSATTKYSADILKFIMSVFVVATHTGLFAPYITPFVRVAVPVFFVLSGYFFFSKVNAIDTDKGKEQYLLKSVKHNLQLYAFWFVVLSPLTFYIRDYFSGGILKGILALLHNFLLGSTFQASWYITALVIGFVILFFLSKKCSNTVLLLIGAVLYMPALLSSNYLFVSMLTQSSAQIYNTLTELLLLPCRNFCAGIIYLVIGKILAEKQVDAKGGRYCIGATVSFMLLVCEMLVLSLSKVHIKDTDCYIMLPVIAYYLCGWVLSLKVEISCSASLRKMSTLSYCAHMAVFMVVGKLLSILDIPDFANIIVFALTLIATWVVGIVILKTEKLRLFRFLRFSH